ncbi:hypothetical protein SCLCIDRAFT_1216541 [Scleroderma citrinum Foug A]|uniref:Uncharacterized protein n=1 Tax=Scleroderma citrinum Foug A TaxID=1036808 RepID=A0A0C3DY49_9AGAM|nr:hypothetical protein SCLCIDRAFT_1216541 [Scleroderma citrinum Foug A]
MLGTDSDVQYDIFSLSWAHFRNIRIHTWTNSKECRRHLVVEYQGIQDLRMARMATVILSLSHHHYHPLDLFTIPMSSDDSHHSTAMNNVTKMESSSHHMGIC